MTFSIVTAFKETGFNADGQEIQRSQCHISPAQREASEFLILTFSDDRDTIALLPHRIYWPVEGEESTGGPEPLSDEIPASTLSAYSFSITLLLANIEEVKRSALNPMHPSTTLFQIGLDGKAPKACEPEAIMPQALKGQITESDQSTLASSKEEEKTLRTIHEKLSECCPSMKVDFLDYQPLLRDFKIIITSGGEFPNGLEAVINHSFGRFNTTKNDDNSHHLTYADYLLSHSVPFLPNVAYFIPRRLIPKVWFTEPHGSFPELCDSGRHVRSKDFIFQMNDAGRWVRDIWKIICKYPPDEHPTPAEKKQEIWKKALPWPEIEAQEALQKGTTQQKARRDKGHSKHDSGTGDGGAVEPSDVSQLPTHYLEKASSDHKLGRR